MAVTLVSYGLTEIVRAYGFLAALLIAPSFRHTDREHKLQAAMHGVAEQIERLAMIVLLLFGRALVGGLLSPVSWADAGIAAAILLVDRPAAGLASLAGFGADRSMTSPAWLR